MDKKFFKPVLFFCILMLLFLGVVNTSCKGGHNHITIGEWIIRWVAGDIPDEVHETKVEFKENGMVIADEAVWPLFGGLNPTISRWSQNDETITLNFSGTIGLTNFTTVFTGLMTDKDGKLIKEGTWKMTQDDNTNAIFYGTWTGSFLNY